MPDPSVLTVDNIDLLKSLILNGIVKPVPATWSPESGTDFDPTKDHHKWPIDIVARTKSRMFKSLTGMTAQTFWAKLVVYLQKVGWRQIDVDLYESGDQEGPTFALAQEEWYHPRSRLKIQYDNSALYFTAMHSNNEYQSDIMIVPIGMQNYWLFLDPFSVHFIGSRYNGFGDSFSYSNIHVTHQDRLELEISQNVYMTQASEFLLRGTGLLNGRKSFVAACSRKLGNRAGMVEYAANPQIYTMRSPVDVPSQFDSDYVHAPCKVAWGNATGYPPLLRGFLWNWLYIFGARVNGQTVKTLEGRQYFTTYAHSNAMFSWEIK